MSLAAKVSFRFVYLKSDSSRFDGFRPSAWVYLICIAVYESEHLFPVFRNRQMPRRRPDYADYVHELDLGSGQ